MRDSKFSITNVLAIAGKELRTAFITPLAYILLAGFLLTSGFFFFTLVQIFNQRLPQAAMLDEPMNLHEWVLTPFYSTLLILLVFILPILSMRSFAEERQRGTMELLLSAPLSLTDLVWGKFLGAAGIVGVMLLVVGVFPISLALVGEIERMPMLIGFIGVVLFAAAFLALGVAISALTSSQTVAAIISFCLLYTSDAADE